MEWTAMLALIEGYPNVDVTIFYVVMAAVVATALYRFHHKQAG